MNTLLSNRTMESLSAEKNKREKELKMLESSEPKLRKELESLREAMAGMRADSKAMADIDGLRQKFERTKAELLETTEGYRTRKVALQQQVGNFTQHGTGP